MNVEMLKDRMAKKGFNVERLAAMMDIDRSTLYRKLAGGEKITIGEAVKIKNVLGLTNDDARAIFFG